MLSLFLLFSSSLWWLLSLSPDVFRACAPGFRPRVPACAPGLCPKLVLPASLSGSSLPRCHENVKYQKGRVRKLQQQ